MSSRGHSHPARRSLLAAGWLAFLAGWVSVALLALGLSRLTACGGDGGTPYFDPASAQGLYCEGVHDYFGWGEPGNLAALPYVAPIALVLAVGAVGIRRRSPRYLLIAGAALLFLPVLHVLVATLLPG
jgi:hypothetical protein